jgi:hypothetical protein
MNFAEWLDYEIKRKRAAMVKEAENLRLFSAERMAEEIANSNISSVINDYDVEIRTLENCRDQFVSRI